MTTGIPFKPQESIERRQTTRDKSSTQVQRARTAGYLSLFLQGLQSPACETEPAQSHFQLENLIRASHTTCLLGMPQFHWYFQAKTLSKGNLLWQGQFIICWDIFHLVITYYKASLEIVILLALKQQLTTSLPWCHSGSPQLTHLNLFLWAVKKYPNTAQLAAGSTSSIANSSAFYLLSQSSSLILPDRQARWGHEHIRI